MGSHKKCLKRFECQHNYGVQSSGPLYKVGDDFIHCSNSLAQLSKDFINMNHHLDIHDQKAIKDKCKSQRDKCLKSLWGTP